MNILRIMIFVFAGASQVSTSFGSPFVNLDFESAMVPIIEPGEVFGRIEPINLALPGWQGFVGEMGASEVFHNVKSSGAAAIGLYGPITHPANIYEGNYSAFLQPSASVDSRIAQTGLIPVGSQSVRFLARTTYDFAVRPDTFAVQINGQLTPVVRLFEGGMAPSLFAADISSYDGTEVELSFIAFHLTTMPNSIGLDAITFSPAPVPEPGATALLLLGGGLLGLMGFVRHRRACM